MDKKKPYLAVIFIQTIYGGMFLLSKAAFDGGMNNFIFVFYRQAAATIFLIPLALFFEWITLSLDINGVALIYTSATLAAATTNCLPVITFFLAVLLRMEVLRLKTRPGIAKLVGILICLGGAVTLALYKGPLMKLFCLHHLFDPHHLHGQIHQSRPSSGHTWVKGCFLMLTSNTFWGLWIVLQGRVLKSYPSKLLFTALQCFLSTIQSFAIAIAIERDPDEWRLGWNVRLLAVAYCGIVVTGVTYYLQAWVIEKKGPVFLAMSTPLNLIFTIFCSAFLLCEFISLGSVLGGLLLISGLYSVLWGKTREQKLLDDQNRLPAHVDKECTELKVVAVTT